VMGSGNAPGGTLGSGTPEIDVTSSSMMGSDNSATVIRG
jgi:hypothetical protein